MQDSLFVKYFKSRDEFKENIKQTDIDKRRAVDERDSLRSENSVLKETIHALSTKNDI